VHLYGAFAQLFPLVYLGTIFVFDTFADLAVGCRLRALLFFLPFPFAIFLDILVHTHAKRFSVLWIRRFPFLNTKKGENLRTRQPLSLYDSCLWLKRSLFQLAYPQTNL
jgi:hypothetical protein